MCDSSLLCLYFFCFNDTATTEIYTLSLHDALPISWVSIVAERGVWSRTLVWPKPRLPQLYSTVARWPSLASTSCVQPPDRKSTRLNSSHANISYAVFCLKKKKTIHCVDK